MNFRIMSTLAALLLTAMVQPALAVADSSNGTCPTSGSAVGDFVAVKIQCHEDPSSTAGTLDASTVGSDSAASPYATYKWVSVCASADPASGTAGAAADCGQARTCPDTAERLWRLWGRKQSGDWDPLGTQCFGRPPTAADTPKPTVTPGLVLDALRRIGLPALKVQTQPRAKTLVNFETIFYTEPQDFTGEITLLGQQVEIDASPSQYTWHRGDGSSETTTSPGAPYPSKDITYNYTDAHVTVNPSVDVTYTARFRVNRGDWQEIPETVTIAGPTGSLRISEATAVLSGEGH